MNTKRGSRATRSAKGKTDWAKLKAMPDTAVKMSVFSPPRFERVQEGLQAQQPEWLMLARGLNMEWEGPYPGELAGKASWETGIRKQFAYWKALMTAPE